MAEIAKNQQERLKSLNTRLSYETKNLGIREVMKTLEEKARVALEIRDQSEISRRELWCEYFKYSAKLREILISKGLTSAQMVADIATEVYSQISTTIHEYPCPTQLIISVDGNFQSGHLPFIKAVCDFMEIIVIC